LLFSIILAGKIKELQIDKIQKKKIIFEQSKLASMGEMLGNIAHQWRQPLGEINAVVMKIDADVYTKKLTPISLENDMQRIENITRHMSDTLESFNSYFKKDKEHQNITLQEVTNKALMLMENSLQDVKLIMRVKEDLEINLNVCEFTQVLLVILNNTIDAFKTRNTKHKLITISITQSSTNHIVEIEDNAGGIKKKNLSKVFEPYFSTKFKADGIGVGLYMAKMLVEESLQGSLTVQNTKNGAKFTIKL
ncbi:HAMP domain-containing histidine kinase, partial [Sulfurimonas sp. SAG-AH-194-L11]